MGSRGPGFNVVAHHCVHAGVVRKASPGCVWDQLTKTHLGGCVVWVNGLARGQTEGSPATTISPRGHSPQVALLLLCDYSPIF